MIVSPWAKQRRITDCPPKNHFIDPDEVENLVFEIFTLIWASKGMSMTEVRRQFPPMVRLLESQAEARLSSYLLKRGPVSVFLPFLALEADRQPTFDRSLNPAAAAFFAR